MINHKRWDHMTIHVGMPKCASTSLQCNLFSRCAGLRYLGPSSVHFDMNNLELKHRYLLAISCQEEHRYRRLAGEIVNFLEGYFDTEGQPSLISDEGIAHAYYGGVPEACNDRTLVARRYSEIFPGARVLLIIRNQYDFLASNFGEWNRRVFINYPDFHRWLNESLILHGNLISNPLCLPDYHGIYSIYSELFGQDRVKVMPLEQLAIDPDRFFVELAAFIEVELTGELLNSAKQRLNTRTNVLGKKLAVLDFHYPWLRRAVSPRLAKSAIKYLGGFFPVYEQGYTESERQLLKEIYGKDNQLLAKATGLRLVELGYPMA